MHYGIIIAKCSNHSIIGSKIHMVELAQYRHYTPRGMKVDKIVSVQFLMVLYSTPPYLTTTH